MPDNYVNLVWGVVVRMPDSQSREPGFESSCCHFDHKFNIFHDHVIYNRVLEVIMYLFHRHFPTFSEMVT